ncbi:MAG: NAD(P)H-hydrate dehydratase [Clostridia bacterium]|nr:NAD(P)H-hydrate dehydratase [Clostridia bacterium]
MQEVVSVKVMRESDEATIKNKIPSLELMQRAGEAVFKSYTWQGKTAIVCGGGNNAGDGYVLAALLGDRCRLFLLCDKFSPDGKICFDKCVKSGVQYSFIDESTTFDGFDTIVDCIFGTGFYGEVTGMAKWVIDKINQSNAYVISVDIPSGLNGDTGLGNSVISDMTVSIGTIKTGLVLNEAKDKIKKLVNCPIGIDITGERYYLLDKEDFLGVIPQRKNFSHKGTYGYTALWGGCEEYSGAVKLANMSLSSLKAGCGVNKLIVNESIAQAIAPYLLESTLFKMPHGFNKEKIDEALCGVKCLAIGMGWGKGEEHEKILSYILENYAINLVIDADALNTLSAMDLDILKRTKCSVCLTPHVKEFSRLAKIGTDAVSFKKASSFAEEYGVIVLLKGTATSVCNGSDIFFVQKGSQGMATAGSGDVLSGILCGLLGYMPMSIKTVALGAYIAGRAGEIAQSETNAVSMTSSDTVKNIGKAIGEIYGY